MRKIPLMLVLPPLIFASFVVTVLVGMLRDNPSELPSTFIGRDAPQVTALPLGDYPSFDTSIFQDGQVKLVNFWASWCAPCRVEHPNLIELAKEIPIYGINQRDRPDDALKFLDDLGNPFTAISVDENGRQSVEWGVYGLPESFLLDGDGKILLRYVGAITQRRMARQFYPAIAAARGQ